MFHRPVFTFWLGALAALLFANSIFAQIIKLGTVAPEGSPWHQGLQEIGQKWRELSGGKVQLRIYAGGVAGDEQDMVRKIRIGQLHATALTTATLIEIVPDMEAITFPMVLQTDGELDYVIEKLGPEFSRRLEEKGFKVLAWSTAGWVHFFSKQPVISPDDMKKRKLFFWGTDTTYVELLKKTGFNPIPLAITDLLTSLQTGLVDSFAAPPAAALSFQWFALAPNMTDLRWQPLPGATVISTREWDKIPAELRPSLEAAALDVSARLQKKIRDLEDEAVTAMKAHGLTVYPVNDEIKNEWQSLVKNKAEPVFVGPRFSKEIYESVLGAVQEYRARTESAVAGQ